MQKLILISQRKISVSPECTFFFFFLLVWRMLGQFAHGSSPMQMKAILKMSIRFQIDSDKLDKLLELLNVVKE